MSTPTQSARRRSHSSQSPAKKKHRRVSMEKSPKREMQDVKENVKKMAKREKRYRKRRWDVMSSDTEETDHPCTSTNQDGEHFDRTNQAIDDLYSANHDGDHFDGTSQDGDKQLGADSEPDSASVMSSRTDISADIDYSLPFQCKRHASVMCELVKWSSSRLKKVYG